MRINSNINNSKWGNKKRSAVSFNATPVEIISKLAEAPICNGKKRFVYSITNFFVQLEEKFAKLQTRPDEFNFKLGLRNHIPENISKIEIDGYNLQSLDLELNENPFQCKPTSTCGCGSGLNKGQFLAQLLELIGVNEPHSIKIKKTEKFPSA